MLIRTIFVACFIFLTTSVSALPQPADNQPEQPLDRDPRFAGNTRGNIPVPTNAEELRLVSLDLWLKFRQTNQQLYHYIKDASDFRAYSHLCKRHELNVNLAPINALVSRNLQQILLAHFEEPDYAVLETMPREEQAALMKDMAADVYGFEYGYRISAQQSLIEAASSTINNYCVQAEERYYGKYIALLATARRQQN